ncbi:molybdopterin-dependent oxidoreductase [Ornatilinea apprima]|nr:molybdopterin cofactor-binding domain-containing protein [Ornatilinea apprima]
MAEKMVSIEFVLNGEAQQAAADPKQSLLEFLRGQGLFGTKNGCSEGDCGMCTVLLDGKPVRSCMLKTPAADGHEIFTVEGLSKDGNLHPIQEAFFDAGAIQCGFCTPAQLLTVKALLDRNSNPSEDEIREAVSGVLCRCTGYVKIIEATQRAAAMMRGEPVPPIKTIEETLPKMDDPLRLPEAFYRKEHNHGILPHIVYTPEEMSKTDFVGKPEKKVDGRKLVLGKPVFTDDFRLPGMLYAELLVSPHAHARIKNIDASKALALPGVVKVLTYKDLPRVNYASGGQSYPQPLPFDQVSLDDKVRHVGDRVALVAAETPELAQKALRLINVEYEVLPHVTDMEAAMKDGAPVIHDEPGVEGIFDTQHNVIYHIDEHVGDIEKAFAEADHVFEREFRTPKQHHAQMELHACITYWDEDDRLVVRTSTQVPFHVRRIIAPLIGLPIKRIRVVKPRIGGGFGGKQEILLEDLCAHMTIATGRPVRLQYSRRQEFMSGRSRHPQIIKFKLAVKDNEVTGTELRLIGDTGAYASHGLTVQMVAGLKSLTLYNAPNSHFLCDVVYTNTPPAGAFRGYGTMQCEFALEVMMEEIAEKLGLDVIEFKRKNLIKVGDNMWVAQKLGEGREGYAQVMTTSAFDECLKIGVEATDFYNKRKAYQNQSGSKRKGIGVATVMHGSGIAGLDMGAATLKMNDDGSFNLQMGATDLGTGSDTILAQMAAEILSIPVEDFIVYSSDTDFTPFDTGAYASSTTYISGGAVRNVALEIKKQIQAHAADMLEWKNPEELELRDRKVIAPDGRSVTFEQVALSSTHQMNQHQIMATASHMSYMSPPPTAAQFVEVEVDTETGEVKVERMLMVVDCGRVINPITAAGQVEGGMQQALGFAHSEFSLFDESGDMVNARLAEYHAYKAHEMPATDVIFVQTDDPNGPFGAKSISELAIDGVAPALVSAIHDATGVWIRELPLTPEKVWRSLNQ